MVISPNVNTVYPDDALFVGFGQEDVFGDAEEIAEELGLSEDEAEELSEYFEETPMGMVC